MLGTDQNRITNKNSNGLIKPVYKFIKFVTKTSSKIYKLLTYNKT